MTELEDVRGVVFKPEVIDLIVIVDIAERSERFENARSAGGTCYLPRRSLRLQSPCWSTCSPAGLVSRSPYDQPQQFLLSTWLLRGSTILLSRDTASSGLQTSERHIGDSRHQRHCCLPSPLPLSPRAAPRGQSPLHNVPTAEMIPVHACMYVHGNSPAQSAGMCLATRDGVAEIGSAQARPGRVRSSPARSLLDPNNPEARVQQQSARQHPPNKDMVSARQTRRLPACAATSVQMLRWAGSHARVASAPAGLGPCLFTSRELGAATGAQLPSGLSPSQALCRRAATQRSRPRLCCLRSLLPVRGADTRLVLALPPLCLRTSTFGSWTQTRQCCRCRRQLPCSAVLAHVPSTYGPFIDHRLRAMHTNTFRSFLTSRSLPPPCASCPARS